MKNTLLSVNDTYEIVANSIFQDYDRKVLLRLYQPIIGYEATSLYLNLWTELEGDQTISKFEKKHERLVAIMQCSIRLIEASLRRLEALGLLQTFLLENANEDRYIYQLFSPKTPQSFYQTDVLDLMLLRALGNFEYERTKQYFTNVFKPSSDYREITAKFSDIFSLTNMDQIQPIKPSSGAIMDHVEAKVDLHYDFAPLQDRLSEFQVSISKWSQNEKETVANIAYAYAMSLHDLTTIIMLSLKAGTQHHLDVNALKFNARKYMKTPNLSNVVKENQPPQFQTGNQSLDQKIAMYHNLTSLEFLRYLNKDQPVLEVESYLIASLKKDTPLHDAVINVIIDYVAQQNNHRLPKAYVQKIAGSLVRAGILEQAYDAMMYLNQNGTNQQKPLQSSKEVTTSNISHEQAQQALQEIKSLREKGKKDGKTKI